MKHITISGEGAAIPICILDGLIPKRDLEVNISSVVEFQRWWVLKSKLFAQESKGNFGTNYFEPLMIFIS